VAKKVFIKPGNGSLFAAFARFLEEVQENEKRQMRKSMSMSIYFKDSVTVIKISWLTMM